MNIDKIKNYVEGINLNDYDLGGVEITEDDYIRVQDLMNEGRTIEQATKQMLCEIRDILDNPEGWFYDKNDNLDWGFDDEDI